MDMGYRGHGPTGDVQVHVDKRRRGRTPPSLRHRVKRRAAIEPEIGHLKREHRIDHNRLKGIEGDRIDAILCAAGMNFRKPQRFAAAFFFCAHCPCSTSATVACFVAALVVKDPELKSTIRKKEFFRIDHDRFGRHPSGSKEHSIYVHQKEKRSGRFWVGETKRPHLVHVIGGFPLRRLCLQRR